MYTVANLSCCILTLVVSTGFCDAEDWTRFRGPTGSGVNSKSTAPTSWSTDSNMKWKVDLPGPGSSCPIVYNDRVYLTCFTGYGVDPENPGDAADLKRHLLCFDRKDGKELWRSTIDSEEDEDPFKGFIMHHGFASSTPVTDGKLLFVHFGKTGLFAFDTAGKQLWKKNVGTKSDPNRWGNGASCVLYKDLVILNAGNTDNAIIAFKKSDGTEVWRVSDEKFTNTWSTPIIVTVDGRDEMIINMPGKILSYNPVDGEEIWWASSPIKETICGSCVYDNGVVYAMGGREGRAIAVRAGGTGDVSETHTLWKQSLRSGINTPVIANGHLYWVSTGRVFCASCETGDYVFRERLISRTPSKKPASVGPSGDYASPVIVGDKILFVTKTGATHVLEISEEYKQVGENSFLGDGGRFSATPAVSDDQIFVRSDNKLYCIAKS